MMTGRVLSQESGVAPYETFFRSFDFKAYAFFNYWMPDETTNNSLQLENRDVNSMPRFVKLVWNTAPNLPEQQEAYDKLNPPNKVRTSDNLVVPGAKDQYIVDGIAYAPVQLEFPDFSQISNVLANSDIAPGVITSVVSLPLASAGILPAAPSYRIDLDHWYSIANSNGVYIQDLRNMLMNRVNGYFNLTRLNSVGVSAKNIPMFNELFVGQFTAVPSSFVDPTSKISSVNPSPAALSLVMNPATTARPSFPRPLSDIFAQVAYNVTPKSTVNSVRVNFVDTGIASVVDATRVGAAATPAHANSVAASAQVLSNLVSYSMSGLQNITRKIVLTSFPAPTNVASKEYVGYLIEKYQQVNGVFEFRQLIGIGDPNINSYYDTQVVYGGIYHYRMRSVIRWTRPRNIGATGVDPTVANKLSSAYSHSNISTTSLTPNYCSYFGSEWSSNWAAAHIIDDVAPNPPDQLQLLPQSNKPRIVVTFAIPDNEQRDIYQMTLYRSLVDTNSRAVRTWSPIATFDMTRSGYYEDTDVEFSPSVPQGTTYQLPLRYVYAVTCTSIHNGESVMSEQLGARLNPEWQQKGEFAVEFFSSAGVNPRQDFGVFATIPVKMYKTHIVAIPQNKPVGRLPAKIVLSGQERWGTRMLNGNKYIIRLHSLDNGETFDIDFATSMINLAPQAVQVPSNIYIPSANEQYVYDNGALTSG